ncbi:NAD-dependent epimerase/dehydratase family protein [Streptomyces sp. NPDC046909]|uniref:dTDP-glucose 4,6-dehydratase n=1 Tax=Streptomyces sp. NPDC046909 TaxID=3155617 RepID=UPI0033D7333F
MTTTRILVTGGAGFVGSHYVRALLGPDGPPGVAVTVLDRQEMQAAGRFTSVRGDICDAELVGKLVSEHDQVVHFAAQSPVRPCGPDADGFLRTNVMGTHTLLAAALRDGLRTFVHISTDEVYGSIRAGSCPETDPLRPNSPYAASKAAADLIALAHHRTHGLDVRVVRCSATYGPQQSPEAVVPMSIACLLKGRPVRLRGQGLNVRDWIHIDDHVRGVELVRTHGRPGEVYNIGGGNELSDRELTGLLLRECGAYWHMVESVEASEDQDSRCSADFTKIRTELGYAPDKDLATGLAETVAWYRTHRSWWEPLLQRSEQGAA